MNFEHIIFDCDGVLVDSEIIAAEVMTPVLNTFGHAVTVKHYLTQYTGKTFRAIFDQFDIDQRVDVEMLIKNVEEKVYLNIAEVQGISHVVNSLSLPKSVVSNSHPDQIRHAVSTINLSDAFEKEFSSSMVENPKPSPDVYLYAAENLGISPESCLVVEDSISGCTAALEANMRVVGFCGGKHIMPMHKGELQKLGVQFIADNSTELLSTLNRLIKKELVFTNS